MYPKTIQKIYIGLTSIGAKVSITFLGLLNGVLLARLLSVEDRGVYGVGVVIAGMVTQIGGLGIPSASAYFVARGYKSREEILYGGIIIAMIIFAIGCLWSLFYGINDLEGWLIICMVAAGSINIVMQIIMQIFVAEGRINRVNLLSISTSALSVIGTIAVITFFQSSKVALVLFALISLLSTFAAGMSFGISMPKKIHVDFTFIKNCLGYGIHPYLNGIMYFIVTRGAIALFPEKLSSENLGLYAVFLSLIDGMLIIASVVQMMSYKDIVKNEIKVKIYNAKFRFLILIAFWFVSMLMVREWGYMFVPMVFGEEYLESGRMLERVWWGTFILGVLMVLANHFSRLVRPKLVALAWFLGGLYSMISFHLTEQLSVEDLTNIFNSSVAVVGVISLAAFFYYRRLEVV